VRERVVVAVPVGATCVGFGLWIPENLNVVPGLIK